MSGVAFNEKGKSTISWQYLYNTLCKNCKLHESNFDCHCFCMPYGFDHYTEKDKEVAQ